MQNWRYQNNSFVGLGIPALFGLDENDSELKMDFVPSEVFNFTLSHACEKHRGEYSLLLNVACGKELSGIFRGHELGQGLLRQSKLFNKHCRICEKIVLFDCLLKECVETLQFVIDGLLGDFLVQLLAAQPAVFRIHLRASALWIRFQFLSKLLFPACLVLTFNIKNLTSKSLPLVVLNV
jgi:hypothetical protein